MIFNLVYQVNNNGQPVCTDLNFCYNLSYPSYNIINYSGRVKNETGFG